MTKNPNKMLQISIGNRLKQLAKEKKLTREALADIMGYSVTHISRIYSGESELRDEVAEILSDKLGVRKEYILCQDNFKTNDDFQGYSEIIQKKEMKIALLYLNSLGLNLHPTTSLYCNLTGLKRNLSTLEPYLKKESLEKIKKNYDFSLPTCDFYKTYFTTMCSVELCSPLPKLPFLTMDNLTKDRECTRHFFIPCTTDNIMKENFDITLYFKVYYENKFITTISESKLQEFVKKLDSFSKFLIENILLDRKNFI